jgi:hypothetical protein
MRLNASEFELIPVNNDNEKKKSIPRNKIAKNNFLLANKDILEFEKLHPNSYRDIINKGLVDYAEEEFTKWYGNQKNTWMYFKQKDKLIHRFVYDEFAGMCFRQPIINMKMLGLLENRFSISRNEKVRKRMAFLSYKYRNKPSVLLTLTIDPKRYNFDFIEINDIANKEFNRFMTNLRTHFKNKGKKLPPYIKTSEFMIGRPENNYISRGLIHFHICFFGASRILDFRELRKYWKIGHLFINRKSNKKKIRKPIDYITKYITKSVDIKNKKMIITQSMNWLFNIRSYSNSKGLIYPLYYKKEVADFDLICGIKFKKEINDDKDLKFVEKVVKHIDKFGM